jgi:SNF2 family DNA or RNA helicase
VAGFDNNTPFDIGWFRLLMYQNLFRLSRVSFNKMKNLNTKVTKESGFANFGKIVYSIMERKIWSPDAVRLLPSDNPLLQPGGEERFESPELYRLRLQAEHAILVAGFDELICLEGLNFTPFDYQVRAAQVMLRRFRGRGMFCDEVGLGKTIEAGLVLKEYLERDIVERVLIVTPPGLVEQWREEAAIKFGLGDFVTSLDPKFRALGEGAWQRFPRIIASLATARRAEHRAEIQKIPYDLVIVDEAHHLKNRSSVSWKFVNKLQRKYILLLTATPVENNLDELYNLITLLKPGQLKTPREFRSQFVVRGDPRLPKNRGKLRQLLGDVMVRHTRGQVDLKLPPRRANTVRLALSPAEVDLYEKISAFIRARLVQGKDGDGAGLNQTDRFTLLTLQREIGSSPMAAEPTLRSLAARQEDDELRARLLALAEESANVKAWAKADALEKLLGSILGKGAPTEEKVIIFTHFLRTLDGLIERLERMGVPFVVYHGRLNPAAKQRAIDDFEHEAQVLLSTEAAGEGRNLQFCRTMINFDVPWNPMRIEQRVGRIHRVGQEREVHIYNLSARGTIEDYLLEIIDQKLNMFELVIGEMDMILGRLSDERDFEELVLDVWVRARTKADADAGFHQLGESLRQARQVYQTVKEYDEALFGEDFSAD